MLHAQESRLSLEHRAPTLAARLWRGRVAYLLVLPTFLFLALFFYYPAWIALSRAFTDWDGFNPPQFVGLSNFRRALSDPVMGLAARNNLLWAVTGLFVSVVPPFLVAELLISLRSSRGQYLYRSAFVAPLVVPLVVSLLVWTYFYHNDGVVNQALQFVGLGKLARAWSLRIGRLRP